MPVFVEIVPDPFAGNFQSMANQMRGQASADRKLGESNVLEQFNHVRRPVRGFQLKRDTYATIEVKMADGSSLSLVDAGGQIEDKSKGTTTKGRTNRYSNFLVQSIQESREEKQQVVLTFGEPYIFFYGEQPRMLQIAGVLMNTEDFNWRAEWWDNYDKYLRGTKAVEQHARVYLSWDDIIVEGYLLNCSAQDSADNRNIVMFNFTMFLTNYANISNIGDPAFPGSTLAEVNLNVAGLDTTGEGIGTLKSDTLKVRSLNIQNEMFSKASLMDFVRDGLQTMVTVYDQVMDVFQTASQFLGGRMVRVPVGYEGSAVFDDAQLAQASLGNLGEGQPFALSTQLGNQAYMITGTVGDRWSGQKGMPGTSWRFGVIRLNTDEYIATQPTAGKKPLMPTDIFADQKAQENDLILQMRKVFLGFGVSVEPPSELLLLAGRATFAMLNLAAPAGGFGHAADLATLALF